MARRPATLVAIATIPEREHLLPKALNSLRHQADKVHVYLNGHAKVPVCVKRLADEYVHDSSNGGAEKKLHWCSSHHGVYLTCDDDFVYTNDYVRTMVDAVLRWKGRAIVTAHGRAYVGSPRSVHQTVPGSVGIIHNHVKAGRWINHGGSGVMAWDTERVSVPNSLPERNIVDMQLAVWAQENRVPMWLIPHKAKWLHSMASMDPKGIFRSSQKEGHERRNRLLKDRAAVKPWEVFRCD